MGEKTGKLFLTAIALGLTCIVFSLFIYNFAYQYSFIKGSDSYYWLEASHYIVEKGEMPIWRPFIFPRYLETYPPLFALLASVFSMLGGINLYFFYYVIGSLIFGNLAILASYILLVRLTKKQWLAILFSFLGTLSPSYFLSISKVLPSIVNFPFTFIFLYLIIRCYQEKRLSFYFLALALWFFWTKFHAISFLFLPIVLIMPVLFFWKNKKVIFALPLCYFLGFLITLLVFKIAWLWTLVGLILGLIQKFLTIFDHFDFTNLGRTYYGWKYYPGSWGYHIFILGILGMIFLFLRYFKCKRWRFGNYGFIFLFFLSFYFFMDIIYRFGIKSSTYAYRSIPFVGIALMLIGAKFLTFRLFRDRRALTIFLVFFLLLYSASIAKVKSPKGWILGKEIEAAFFLRNSTPYNSIIITQSRNHPLVSYFAQRDYLVAVLPIVNNFFRNSSSDNIIKFVREVLYDDDSLEKLYKNFYYELLPETAKELKVRPKYVLFSRIKTKENLEFGNWWKESVVVDANLSPFEDKRYFKKVFDNGDAVIWKLKKIGN